MSDTHLDSDVDSISDSSNAHSDDYDDDDIDDEAFISANAWQLCKQLRANDPMLCNDSVFAPFSQIAEEYGDEYSGDQEINILEALKENTSVKHIDFTLFRGHYTSKSALAAAEYVESSKTLQIMDLSISRDKYYRGVRGMIKVVLRALSRNKSVTKLVIHTDTIRIASVAFQEFLTCTQTLQELQIMDSEYDKVFNEKEIAAVASGFANNTTLRDLKFMSWGDTDLTPVLTALQHHPVLQKIQFSAGYGCPSSEFFRPSLSGLEVLLRSQDSKVKELILEQVSTATVGLHPVLQELGHNTRVTKLTIRKSTWSRENAHQLQAALRQNTALQYLNLTSSALESAGLAEIAPVLYRNTSIKTLDLSDNGLDDIESANLLRELLRRNKSITSLCIGSNAFGRNAAATRSILEGVRCNTALQQLDLLRCDLDDRGVSILANALAIRNAGMLELDLGWNGITSVGVRALVEDNMEAVKTLTKLCLTHNPVRSEGATIMADALGRNAIPNLKRLHLRVCQIDDDGFVALVSALEQNTSLQILDLGNNVFNERGFVALAESLPNIKELQEIGFTASAGFQSTLPLLLEGFRKNTSLVEVVITQYEPGEWSRELKFLGQRNRFTPLLKASDPEDASPQLGIWSRALAKVATEPDVLFHVLRNKPKLVGSVGDSKKRKRIVE
jgi:Ran GTPase-activating protein (RanGAP) involved in mRNA processing and transport